MGEQFKYWKAFRLDDLFKIIGFSPKNQKDLDISSVQDNDYTVALVSSSKENNGIVGYIKSSDVKDGDIYERGFTFAVDGSMGHTFYQSKFTGNNHIYHLSIIDKNIDKLVFNLQLYVYFNSILTHIFAKSGMFSYAWKPKTELFNREIILLPVITCKPEDSIWQDTDEDGNITYLTLDVEYIKELMEAAKKRKEEKTIGYYEAEKAKYEAEKAKYESNPDFVRKLKESHFKAFNLGDLFEFKNDTVLSKPNKYLDISETQTEECPIALVSTSSKNNGIVGYISRDEAESKERVGYLTLDKLFGNCFYQEQEYVNVAIWNIGYIDIVDPAISKTFTPDAYRYMSKLINHLSINSGIYGYNYTFSWERFCREIILLPVISCEAKGEDDIQPDIMSYYYILGQERLYQNKINHYNQLIGE